MGRAFKFVVLGGGNAAGYAAHEFIKRGIGPGELCIISEEPVAPYERPALSKGYLLPEGAVRLPAFHTCVAIGHERQVRAWYQDHGIELLLNTRVTSADVKKRALTTQSGETITYKTMIVATGARVLRLEEFGVTGADASNICYLRDIRDAAFLVDAMRPGQGMKAVVIGGGYIGMECTAALVANKLDVTMVYPEPHCMARLFTPEIAQFYEDRYRKKGVKFVKGTVMAAFEKSSSGKVAAVILKDGTRLPADLVVVGVGIRANTALFEGQLAIEKGGIKVDSKFRTSVSTVYAVGDVAAFPVKLYGDIRRLEHVDHARKSARHAVSAILSGDTTKDYDYLPFFYSRVFNLSWQFYGDNVGKCVLFGDQSRGKFGAYWIDERNAVVGTFLEGGSSEDYTAMARVARVRPEAPPDLADLGLSFATKLPAGELSQSSAAGKVLSIIEDPYTWQIGTSLALVVGVAAVAYWHHRRRKKLL
ncbi:monodehydroascorbate reductase [Klebsormidium nitens]|uniref:monodehydroascorbate reductase (NADH) n=1 Tax=Klebsormidium nitens TaxID=105231 RepID=A0A1Y1I616_KLENI|nr:monodehydroascorbate reductase [Klebsormidium nitens]|eukprot:GAQ86404.1 monodehydroascorbate reductase [Klebsormidium nitens]